MEKNTPYVLWLVSWYPNPLSPYDGDFIQRHARAVASYTRIKVFYISQAGEAFSINESQILENEKGNLSEKIICFRFKKSGIKWIDKFRYNIIYYRTYKKTIKNYILNSGLPDIVHVHIPMKAGMIALWMKRRWQIPYIVSEHSSLYNNFSEGNFFKRNLLHQLNVKRIFRKAVIVTNVSVTVGQTIRSLFGLSSIKVIYNTVNTSLFNYKILHSAKFRFIHVSALVYQKNIEGILHTVKRLAKFRQDFELVIVGPIGLQLKRTIDKPELSPFVLCTGEIPYHEVAIQMQRASALVMFSRHENFPCVIIEALCCGLPVIATNVGGISEVIQKDNGMLVESENEEQLFEAMNKMIDEYLAFDKKKIAEAAQQRFSYSVVGKQIYDLYKEVLKSDS